MILDTCALLFLPAGDARLSAAARSAMAQQRQRWYCAISAFEIALKHAQGKLQLPEPPLPWLQKLAVRYDLTEVPFDSELCASATTLPPHHRDPCDRFIIAAALRLRVPVVTVDPMFAPYGVQVIA